MSEAINPPDYYFPGVNFNPAFYANDTGGGFTEAQANALYLKKKVPDTATALETFNSGIKTNSIELVSGTALALPASTTTAPATEETGSSRVVTSKWVRDQGYVTATTGNVTYNGVGPFTTIQSFSANIKTDRVLPYQTGGNVDINSAVADTPSIPDNTARVPTTNWVNTTITNALNATTLFAKLAGTTAFTALQTFNLGIKTNDISLVSGSTLSLPASTTTAPVGGDSSSRVVTSQWVVNEGYAKTTVTNIWSLLQTFSSGIKTNTITTVTGNLSLPASTTTAPVDLNDNSTRVPTTDWIVSQAFLKASALTNYALKTVANTWDLLQTFSSGIKTNTITTVTGNLSLPASTTVTPVDLNDNSTLVPTTAWIKSQNYTSSAGFVTYNGVGPFTTQQTFSSGVKTDSIALNVGSSLSLPASTTTTPTVPDNTTRVPTTSWVNTTITNALNATTLFAKLAGTTAFTAVQTFNLGIKTNSIVSGTDSATMTIGTNQNATGKVSIGSNSSIVNIKNDSGAGGSVNIMSSDLTGGNINIGNYSTFLTPTWTLTTIEGDVDIGNPDRDIHIYGNILGTLKTDSIAPTTTNGEIILGSTTGTMILNGEVTATTQAVGTAGNFIATCDFVLANGGGGGFNPNTTQITPTYTPASDLTKLGGFAVFQSTAGTAPYSPVILCPTTNVPNGYYMVSVTITSSCSGNMSFSRPSMFLYSSTTQQTSYGPTRTNVAGDASTYGMDYRQTSVWLDGFSGQPVTITQTGNVWVGASIGGVTVGNFLAMSFTEGNIQTALNISFARMVLTRLA
jgi:hypothetical protein